MEKVIFDQVVKKFEGKEGMCLYASIVLWKSFKDAGIKSKIVVGWTAVWYRIEAYVHVWVKTDDKIWDVASAVFNNIYGDEDFELFDKRPPNKKACRDKDAMTVKYAKAKIKEAKNCK